MAGRARLAGLDGLRALAVVAVLVYHADPASLPGGFLGVDLFFVLSGFLITGLLLASRARGGRIDVADFWRRRLRRLVPAMVLVVAATLLVALVALPEEVPGLRRDALGALGYVSNWQLILADESYFEAIGRPPLLRHLWSLAVEAQFYLAWPIVLGLALRFLAPHLVLLGTVAAALGSAAWMAVLHDPESDPSRLYFGTDTRLSGLLLGAALGFVSTRVPSPGSPERAAPGPRSGRRAHAWDVVGLIALAGIAAFLVAADSHDPVLYRGGFLVFAGLAVVLVAALVEGGGRLARLFELPPARWIGERSYGIYLWHWPIYQLSRPAFDAVLEPLPAIALRVGLTVALADLSYRFVEQPIRRDGLVPLWHGVRRAGRRSWIATTATASAAVACVGLVLSMNLVPTAEAARPAYLPVDRVAGYGTADGRVVAADRPDRGEESPAAAAPEPEPSATPAADAGPASSLPEGTADGEPAETATPRPSPPPATPVPPGRDVLAVGDSVMVGAAPALAAALPGLEIDAEVGRFFKEGIALVEARAARGDLPPVVVVHLGNNEPFYDRHVDRLMRALADVPRVVVVNVRVPREWEAHDNRVLDERLRLYPNAVLADWHGATRDRHGLFWDDGIHVRPKGATVYAKLVARAISGG